jgi:predicted GNAT family acetyltransferase
LLHYFINTLIAKVVYMLLMVWDIVPVCSIPTNNKQNRKSKKSKNKRKMNISRTFVKEK